MEKETSLWRLLGQYSKIVVPAIQRDYAQGRDEKSDLRARFLQAIYDALRGESKPLLMDFVYGACEDNRFIPLDGQQRLTTLWLLHWYLAYKLGYTESKDIRNTLSKFAYETRTSSTTFCQDLCGLSSKPDEEGLSLRDWIVSQTWFYNHYKADPTIRGMLNMICGTEDTQLKDGIDKRFEGADYKFLWNKLTNTTAVGFYNIPIKIDDSDELYVKMNARGRQLTNFENFKAELIERVKELTGDAYAVEFASKIDVDWTDIFWPNRYKTEREEVTIDEIYFAFIRRYAYNEWLRRGNERQENLFPRIYSAFDNYAKVFEEAIDIERLTKTLDNIQKALKDTSVSLDHASVCAAWDKEDKGIDRFEFIPSYQAIGAPEIHGIQEKDRPAFYALCRYFEHGEYDETSFNDWKRVVWNICENSSSEITSLLDLFDKLAPYSHDVLTYLSLPNLSFSSNRDQMEEECQKALHWDKYKDDIIEAENYAFFKGVIRFLFKNKRGEYDWSDFITKWHNAQLYFDNSTSNSYMKESILLRRYIILSENNLSHFVFDNQPLSWRERLIDTRWNIWHSINHVILTSNEIPNFEDYTSVLENPKMKYAVEFLVKHNIYTELYSGCFLYYSDKILYGSYYLTPFRCSAAYKRYVLNPRVEMLYCCPLISMRQENSCWRLKMVMSGLDIDFIYKNCNFRWWGSPNKKELDLYLMDENWEYRAKPEASDNYEVDDEYYYCVRFDAFTQTQDELLQTLDKLITQREIDNITFGKD